MKTKLTDSGVSLTASLLYIISYTLQNLLAASETDAAKMSCSLLLSLMSNTQMFRVTHKINQKLFAGFNIWLIGSFHRVNTQRSFTREIDLKEPHVNITRFFFSEKALVSYIPDINGDNKPELLLGFPTSSAKAIYYTGTVFLIWGNESLPSSLQLREWDNMNLGIRFDGAAYWDQFGSSLTSVPDINGDQKPELLVGAHYVDRNNQNSVGSTYLIWGNPDLPKTIDLAKWNSLNIGTRFDGDNEQNWNGASVGYLPDVNGDNIPELLIGANGAHRDGKRYAGSLYIIWGKTSFPSVINLVNWNSLNLGVRIDGSGQQDKLATSVTSMPDINGDGLPEIVIGASGGSIVYLLWGSKNLPSVVDLAQWESNPLGIRFDGAKRDDKFGHSLSVVNDINGDNLPELLITATGTNPSEKNRAGSVFLIWGNPTLEPIVKISEWNNHSLGIRFDGPERYSSLGTDVSTIADLNGDGIPELVLGAGTTSAVRRDLGTTYLIWGNKNYPKVIDLRDWANLNIGVQIHGEYRNDGFGYSIDTLPDISGDGIPEILIGTQNRGVYLIQSEAIFNSKISTTASTSLLTTDTRQIATSSHTGTISDLAKKDQSTFQALFSSLHTNTSTSNSLNNNITVLTTSGVLLNSLSESSSINLVIIVTVAILSCLALLACAGYAFTRITRDEDDKDIESVNQYDVIPSKKHPSANPHYNDLLNRPPIDPTAHYLSDSKAKIEFRELAKHNLDNQSNRDQISLQILTTGSNNKPFISGQQIRNNSNVINDRQANYDDIPNNNNVINDRRANYDDIPNVPFK